MTTDKERRVAEERQRYITWIKNGLAASPDKTQKGIAEALGIAAPQISYLLSGVRGLKVEEIPAVSKYLGISPPQRQYPLVGRVAAGGHVVEVESSEGEQIMVEGPDDLPFETVAVDISGGSLGPGFDGWRAFYSQRYEPFHPDLFRKLCVVGTEDGRVLVKWVRPGAKGYTLHSGLGEIEEDVKIAWAAKVSDLRPAD